MTSRKRTTMADLDTPKLRQAGLKCLAGPEPDTVVVVDTLRLSPTVTLPLPLFYVMRLFDGERTLAAVQSETAKMLGQPLPLDVIGNLATRLDDAFLLESPRLTALLTTPDRPPVCIGVYDADPDKARAQLRKLFTAKGGPGLPGEPGCRVPTDGEVRAVLLPHMDYARGGVTYGWGFKELVERTDASLFVIVATGHHACRRFVLSRQNFTSPFGRVETDQGHIDRIVRHYGDGLFDDVYAHAGEHSIELEVVGMQFAFAGRRPFRIVPLLCGGFFDCVRTRTRPAEKRDVTRMIRALARAEEEAGETVCYVISGDLAHIGPKFDDPDLVEDRVLRHSKSQDDLLIERAVAADADGYFDVIAAEEDARRICGLPPTYVTLAAARPGEGKLLHYGRFVHPEGFESVSFASMAFER